MDERDIVKDARGRAFELQGRPTRIDDYVELIKAAPVDRYSAEYTLVRFLYPNVGNEAEFNPFFNQRNKIVPILHEFSKNRECYYMESGDESYLGFKTIFTRGREHGKSYFEPIRRPIAVEMGRRVKKFTIGSEYRKEFFLSLARAIRDLHSKGVVHASISPFSVGIWEGKAWIGGFYSAFPANGRPYFAKDEYGRLLKKKGMEFYSPELGEYFLRGHEEVDCQTDIFSLGMYFHWCMSGELPTADRPYFWTEDTKEEDYTWKHFEEWERLKISSKIRGEGMRWLLGKMLCYYPEDRITAEEVCKSLNLMSDTDLYTDEDEEVFYELPRETRETRTREHKPRKEKSERYEVKEKKVEIPEGFEEPWSEHKISWNEAKLRARGFIAARCKEQAGIKGYDLYREDSSNMFFTKEKLTMMGYVDKACATKVSETSATAAAAPVKATAEKATTATVADKATPVKLSEEPTKTFCAPWAEHNVAFNKDVLAAKGYCGAKTEMRGGIKGYVLFYTAGGERFLTVETLCMLKLANKVDVKAVSIAETTETAELDTGHVCVETVDEAVETTAVEEKKTEEPMYPLFLEDDGVEAYCMQKVCDNPAIKGLQEACANLAEERKQYTEQAIVCASRYYLQIKNSQEVLEGEELAAYEKTDKVYNAITAGEELFAYGKPFTDIEGILAEIEETKLEKTLVEKDVDALEEKAEGAFADLLKAIDEGFALKAKVEEIFNINIGLKEQAEEWIRENFGELLTDSAVESCIFNKEDCETWKNCVSGIISCEEKMRDKEKELSKALERQAEAYWKENAEEICEAIRDDEVENVSDETRNRWNLQAKEESEGGVPTDMEDEE